MRPALDDAPAVDDANEIAFPHRRAAVADEYDRAFTFESAQAVSNDSLVVTVLRARGLIQNQDRCLR